MNQNAIPQELKQLPQWVTWQFEKEGKPVSKDTEGATKIPYNARTGHKASSTNPNTWTEFAVAVQAAKATPA
jgi:primase-polymerase (primpol)-like protein